MATFASPLPALENVLTSNFSAVSTPALEIIIKYASNVLSSPHSDPRPRRINLENKTFISKVRPCKGATDVLYALGFRRDDAAPNFISINPDDENVTEIVRIRTLIRNALAQQSNVDNIPVDVVVHPRDSPALPSSSTSTSSSAAFDPFKSQSFSRSAEAAGANPNSLFPGMPVGEFWRWGGFVCCFFTVELLRK